MLATVRVPGLLHAAGVVGFGGAQAGLGPLQPCQIYALDSAQHKPGLPWSSKKTVPPAASVLLSRTLKVPPPDEESVKTMQARRSEAVG